MYNRQDIENFSNKYRQIREEIAKEMIGQDAVVEHLLLAVIAGGNVLLEGVPGLGKTHLVRTLSKVLSMPFSRIQFTPDLMPADITGTNILVKTDDGSSFQFQPGPLFSSIVLADEINRATPKTQSALLEAMQEHAITAGGQTRQLNEPYFVLATQNPIEQEGTYPLPEAQVDRFMFKLLVDYPGRNAERTVIERMAHPELQLQAVAVAKLQDIMEARKWVDRIYMDEKILEYILDIVIATRPGHLGELSSRQNKTSFYDLSDYIQVGASPRAGISLALAAKGLAFLEGRAYVTPQDVKRLTADVLRHRIVLSYEAEAEGLTPDRIIERIMNELRTP